MGSWGLGCTCPQSIDCLFRLVAKVKDPPRISLARMRCVPEGVGERSLEQANGEREGPVSQLNDAMTNSRQQTALKKLLWALSDPQPSCSSVHAELGSLPYYPPHLDCPHFSIHLPVIFQGTPGKGGETEAGMKPPGELFSPTLGSSESGCISREKRGWI